MAIAERTLEMHLETQIQDPVEVRKQELQELIFSLLSASPTHNISILSGIFRRTAIKTRPSWEEDQIRNGAEQLYTYTGNAEEDCIRAWLEAEDKYYTDFYLKNLPPGAV